MSGIKLGLATCRIGTFYSVQSSDLPFRDCFSYLATSGSGSGTSPDWLYAQNSCVMVLREQFVVMRTEQGPLHARQVPRVPVVSALNVINWKGT